MHNNDNLYFLDNEAKSLFQTTFYNTHQMNHKYVTTEHLMYTILNNPIFSSIVLKHNLFDLELYKKDLLKYLKLHMPIYEDIKTVEVTDEVNTLINILYSIHSVHKKPLSILDVFTNIIYSLENNYSIQSLTYIGDIDKIINYMIELKKQENNKSNGKQMPNNQNNMIKMYTKKIQNDSKKVFGRNQEVLHIYNTLIRKDKNNILLLGDSGVGKSSIIFKLASEFKNNKSYQFLNEYDIYELNITAMISGAKYKGELEERISKTLLALENLSNVIVYIDEFHVLHNISSSDGNINIINIMKEFLSKSNLKFITVSTYEDSKKILRDKSVKRRFQVVDIKEPSKEETYHIINYILSDYESFYDITYSADIIELIIDLSYRYIKDRKSPDKVIDIIDEIGAISKHKKLKHINKNDLVSLLSKMSGINIDISSNKVKIEKLNKNLKKYIFGQNHIIDEVTKKITIYKAGLNDDNKPICSYLFTGPTGTGKTETAKQIGSIMEMKVLRYDMSEYSEEHTISKFIGSPQGYVGYEDGGLIINDVLKNPNSVILIDEFEKSHQSIQNIFLQILEEGVLTSSFGEKVSFSDTILIFTSNIGALAGNSLGFHQEINNTSNKNRDIKSRFTPEFRNRLDGILEFNSLTPDIIKKIVDKEIKELNIKLSKNGNSIKLTPKAKEYLSINGYDLLMGARPLKRFIDIKVKSEISTKIILEDLNNSIIKIGLKENELIFNQEDK